jgi:hypothetical protein
VAVTQSLAQGSTGKPVAHAAPNPQWPDARPPAARDPAVAAGGSMGYSGDASSGP